MKTYKRILILIVATFPLIISGKSFADHHLSSLATLIALDETVVGNLEINAPSFYVELVIAENGTLVVFSEGTLETYGELLTSSETVLVTSLDAGQGGGTGKNFRFEVEVTPGNYFVRTIGLDPFQVGAFNLVTDFTGEGELSTAELAVEEVMGGVITTDRSSTTAAFTSGAALQNGSIAQSDFIDSDQIRIVGSASPDAADVGTAADIFVVIRTIIDGNSVFSFRNLNGEFITWNGFVATLEPAREVSAFNETEIFEILTGTLEPASYRIFIGYSLNESEGPIHFNSFGKRVDVIAANP